MNKVSKSYFLTLSNGIFICVSLCEFVCWYGFDRCGLGGCVFDGCGLGVVFLMVVFLMVVVGWFVSSLNPNLT